MKEEVTRYLFKPEIEELVEKAEQHVFGQASKWIKHPYIPLEVYMRATNRYINEEQVKTLEIANVSVWEERRRQGYFTRLLKTVELVAKSTCRIVFIEQLHNEWLYGWLQTHQGYELHPSEDFGLIKTDL